MVRWLALLLMLPIALGVASVSAQTKKAPAAPKAPSATDKPISVNVFMRDGQKNELLLGTHIWLSNPDYTAAALQRISALMKALDPPYKRDDDVAYTWANKGRMTKCSIYLESDEAGVKNGTGATVGCEANGVSSLIVTSSSDSKPTPSNSKDPKHVQDVLELFKKQSERAKSTLTKQ